MTDEKPEKISRSRCPHTDRLDEGVTSDAEACEACGEHEHLRLCLTCGFVGCCESKQAHDHEHYDETGHPFITPHRQEYDFLWCYDCGAYLM